MALSAGSSSGRQPDKLVRFFSPELSRAGSASVSPLTPVFRATSPYLFGSANQGTSEQGRSLRSINQ